MIVIVIPVQWIVTLSGNRLDVARLVEAMPGEFAADPDDQRRLTLTLTDPEGDLSGSEAAHAAKAAVDAFVEQTNGLASLRWGRMYEGIEVEAIRSVSASGHSTLHGFVGQVTDYMEYEDFEALKKRLGAPPKPPPKALDQIRALDLVRVAALAESNSYVARALHLVDLSVRGRAEIDWAAGYAALEVVDEELAARGLDGRSLGWWTRNERRRFTATANSPEALGYAARHGKSSGLPAARMTEKDAGHFVRGVVALWLTHLLENDQAAPT